MLQQVIVPTTATPAAPTALPLLGLPAIVPYCTTGGAPAESRALKYFNVAIASTEKLRACRIAVLAQLKEICLRIDSQRGVDSFLPGNGKFVGVCV